MATLPSGSIVVWDDYYSECWGLDLAVLADPANGWQVLSEFGDGFAIVFQKMPGEGAASARG